MARPVPRTVRCRPTLPAQWLRGGLVVFVAGLLLFNSIGLGRMQSDFETRIAASEAATNARLSALEQRVERFVGEVSGLSLPLPPHSVPSPPPPRQSHSALPTEVHSARIRPSPPPSPQPPPPKTPSPRLLVLSPPPLRPSPPPEAQADAGWLPGSFGSQQALVLVAIVLLLVAVSLCFCLCCAAVVYVTCLRDGSQAGMRELLSPRAAKSHLYDA